MLIKDIPKVIDGEVLTSIDIPVASVKYAFASDLMSDVLAFGDSEAVLVTGLINNQVVRTAEMLDLKAIVFVRGKVPAASVIELAEEKNIVLITTHKTLYTTSGLLYKEGLLGLNLD